MKRTITVQLNGAEFPELEARAREASLSVPAYVRAAAGLEPWRARGQEMQDRQHVNSGRPVRLALERQCVSFVVDEDEYAKLDAAAKTCRLGNVESRLSWSSACVARGRDPI